MKTIVLQYFNTPHLKQSFYSKQRNRVSSVALVPSWFSVELLRCDLFEVSSLYLLHFMHSKHVTSPPPTFRMG